MPEDAGIRRFAAACQHKLLKLHEVREGEPTAAYDAVFIGIALAVLLAGLLLRRAARPGASPNPR